MNEQRRDGSAPTTTHAEWGAGRPRFLVSREQERFVYELNADRVRVGSNPDNELSLPDCEPVHATIRHDERDEYVLTLHGLGEMNANPLSEATHPDEHSETLRTGARFTAGPWTLVFSRDEFADHGRPFGGREGGEFSDQRPQPARPRYDAGESDSRNGKERPE